MAGEWEEREGLHCAEPPPNLLRPAVAVSPRNSRRTYPLTAPLSPSPRRAAAVLSSFHRHRRKQRERQIEKSAAEKGERAADCRRCWVLVPRRRRRCSQPRWSTTFAPLLSEKPEERERDDPTGERGEGHPRRRQSFRCRQKLPPISATARVRHQRAVERKAVQSHRAEEIERSEGVLGTLPPRLAADRVTGAASVGTAAVRKGFWSPGVVLRLPGPPPELLATSTVAEKVAVDPPEFLATVGAVAATGLKSQLLRVVIPFGLRQKGLYETFGLWNLRFEPYVLFDCLK
ncbi:uncharacterized protein DS421_12g352450 [Arachis hypogaea]|nr:uncharacterized protein DS421_12g352450 [Arachis hypogaea]